MSVPLLRLFGKAPFVNCFTGTQLLESVASTGFEVLETGLYPKKTHSLFMAARKPAG